MRSIGALGKATNTKVETIRYYERIGLLAPPQRTDGNYRTYDDEALARLSFIRRSRDLGFSLDQVRALLEIRYDRFSRGFERDSKAGCGRQHNEAA
ncbi:MerR-like DNA binding protein, partial [Acetobacter aceti NBRC 14818]